jgi:hypothetical protein
MTNNDAQNVDISVAISPNDIAAVPSLLEEITADFDTLSISGEDARKGLILKARALVQSLETPREIMTKHCWAQVWSS